MRLIDTKHFKQRLLSSSIAIILLTFIIYYSQTPVFKPIFVFLNAAIISLALFEYYQLAQNKGFHPKLFLSIGCTLAYLVSLYFAQLTPTLHLLPSFVLLFSFALFFLAFFDVRSQSLGDLAITVFGFIYLAIPLAYATQLNYMLSSTAMIDGRPWLAYVIIVTKMTDVGAYIVGKTMGKHPLAPAISPKKTIEGALGGLGAAVLTSLFLFIRWIALFLDPSFNILAEPLAASSLRFFCSIRRFS